VVGVDSSGEGGRGPWVPGLAVVLAVVAAGATFVARKHVSSR
jgi:hypothetical protein